MTKREVSRADFYRHTGQPVPPGEGPEGTTYLIPEGAGDDDHGDLRDEAGFVHALECASLDGGRCDCGARD